MYIALTRAVPRSIVNCELTHLDRQPIDWARASAQHEAYEAALRSLGAEVVQLPADERHPDSVFIEDTAVILDACAVITRPGAETRRGETAAVAEALSAHLPLYHIEAPGTLDGGDVLRVDKRLFIGRSTRTNVDGARQLADVASQYGFTCTTVDVRDCLHLKTAVSALPDGKLLMDPRRIDATAFGGAPRLVIDEDELVGANVLVVGDAVLAPAAAPRTRALLARSGYDVRALDGSELAKAEGGLTCSALLLQRP